MGPFVGFPRLINPPPPPVVCPDYNFSFDDGYGDFSVITGSPSITSAAARTGASGVQASVFSTIRCSRNICAGGTSAKFYAKHDGVGEAPSVSISFNGGLQFNNNITTSWAQYSVPSSLTGCITIAYSLSPDGGTIYFDDITITNNNDC